MTPLRGLYAIIDPAFLPAACAPAVYARALLDGGCRVLQLRVKSAAADRYAMAREILQLKRSYAFTFIINDDAECARELHADGVHLGADDLPIAAARAIVGTAGLIGYSAHRVAEAQAAEVAGADYVAFGAIYPTRSKAPGHPVQGVVRLRELVAAVSIPVVAIGGITRERVAAVWATGVAAVAMITGLSQAGDPRSEAVWYVQQLGIVAPNEAPRGKPWDIGSSSSP